MHLSLTMRQVMHTLVRHPRYDVLATWRRAIAAVAACGNVILKRGGLGLPRTGFGWHLRQ